MNFLGKCALPIILAGFLIGGVGCAEEEQKARDRGANINQTINRTKQKAEDAAGKIKDRIGQLEKNLEDNKEE